MLDRVVSGRASSAVTSRLPRSLNAAEEATKG